MNLNEAKTDTMYWEKAKKLVSQMTLEEKASLCSGKDSWNLKAVERLGVESILVCDGPHGLRKQVMDQEKNNLGIGESVPAVCFPTASALACSFDRELIFEVGRAIGEECLKEQVSVILGPGSNQKRSPLCGRNFEYFSEDPKLSGEMAAGFINGVQSTGVGTSLKHFAVNNQEKRRMTVSAVVDERTLRETYLKAFEIAVKKGNPRTVMCAYNRLNGEYCSENLTLLTKILREEWGYDGLVVSDWGAVNDRVLGVKAGLDLEMPGSRGINDVKLIEAVKKQILPEEALDRVACRVVKLMLMGSAAKQKGYPCDKKEHHKLAVKVARESAVLLKNENHILPGNIGQKAAVIGVFSKEPRYQGAGSSRIHPVTVDNAYDALIRQGLDITYAPGYTLNNKSIKDMEDDSQLIEQACEAAKGKDIVYLFAGLPEGYESEGFDRKDLSLPEDQNRLIEAVAGVNANLVVVLMGGAPMELPWVDQVKGILLTYLGGEGCGSAVADLLLGAAIPCGKLAETWPRKLSDTPAYHYFPGGRQTVEYRESIYVGYRYYDKAKKAVRYPFGYGLSYNEFTYSDLHIDQDNCEYGDKLTISFTITNHGEEEAKETALIFVAHESAEVFLPEKELREFVKVSLQPGEAKVVSVELDTKDFGYYNTKISDWYAESGEYRIMVGPSADNCCLKKGLTLHSPEKPQPDMRRMAPSYYCLSDQELRIPDYEFAALYGKELPQTDYKPSRPYHSGNTLEDIQHTLVGKIMIKVANNMARKVTSSSEEEEGMMSNMIREMPFHSMVTSGEGLISERMLEGILDLLNSHYLRGLKKLLKSNK